MSQSGAAALLFPVRLFLPDAPELQVLAAGPGPGPGAGAGPGPERSRATREVLANSKFNFV